jgi:hypothetical protein
MGGRQMSLSKSMRIEVTGGDHADARALMDRLRPELLRRAQPKPQAAAQHDIPAAAVLDKAADELTVTLSPDDMHEVLVKVLTEFMRAHASSGMRIRIESAELRNETPHTHVRHILRAVADTSDLEIEYHVTLWPGRQLEELSRDAGIDLTGLTASIKLTWSMSEWMHNPAIEDVSWLEPLETWPLPDRELARPTLPVTIYLADEQAHDQVEAAVEDLLASVGLQVEERDDPVIGSWFRRMRAALKDAVRSPAAREGALVAAHAADTRLVLAHDAAITNSLSQGVAPVITSLQPTKDAVVRVGAMLIVKVEWKVHVFQLTAAQQARLDHRPQLASEPQEIIAALSLTAPKETGNPPAMN